MRKVAMLIWIVLLFGGASVASAEPLSQHTYTRSWNAARAAAARAIRDTPVLHDVLGTVRPKELRVLSSAGTPRRPIYIIGGPRLGGVTTVRVPVARRFPGGWKAEHHNVRILHPDSYL
jgi:hypothetical protein